MRCFLAIDLTENIKEKIAETINQFKNQDVDVKFVDSHNLHITVMFFGEVNEENMKEISKFMKEALTGMKQFKINIKGLGYFGNPNYIRTIWVDISDGKNELHTLIETINKKLFQFKKDNHAPSVHITIGRVKSGRNKEKLLHMIENVKELHFGEMVVKEIRLKQSKLTPEGPIYTDLDCFSLCEDR
ncbi:MAG: RNA 2',3'-cyclic phosphodiesterase [Candidatus Aenigmarchaeota archaeon]|nr:RNA 2',3'-cyclic phosphodiesterase [Candidatus Aenigmarchaeota archaeon]